MCIGDVGPEGAGGPPSVACEAEMSEPAPAATIHDGARDLVAALEQLPLEVRDEDPEIRVVVARVHLRDEEDLQRVTRA